MHYSELFNIVNNVPKVTTETGWEDYLWFQENDPRLLRRINSLIKDAIRNPFEGLSEV